MDGSLSRKQSPTMRLEIGGMIGKAEEFDAIIDTGFTGQIAMPLIKALPLGLVLFSMASFTLADGSSETSFLCFGRAIVDGVNKPVVISLSKGNDTLLGTELFADFGIRLDLNYRNNTFRCEAERKNDN